MAEQKRKYAGSNFGIDSLPKVSHGQGSWVFDTSGKRYLDGSGGPAVYCLGHANAEVNAAVAEQMSKIAHGYRYIFTSDAADALKEEIAQWSQGHFNNGVLVSSGSEAVESAMKVALQYHAARGEMSRRRFVARQRSYHGNTLGALSVSGFASRRTAFEGSLLPASFLSAANDYRRPQGVSAEDHVAFLAAEFEAEIAAYGAHNIAAFIFEPVVGAAGGVVPAPAGYAKAMREICNRHGILMIADEVMSGSGRTGSWIAHYHDGVKADIMTVAKGLAGGYVPLGATLYSDKVHDVLTGHGGVQTGHTFTAHTAACAAAVAIQKIIRRENLMERVSNRGAQLRQEIGAALADVAEVGDVRGRGYFIGIELVENVDQKRPFDPELKLHAEIGRAAFEQGLIIYPCSGNVDGKAGDTLIIAPPYNASDDELGLLVETLSKAIRSGLAAIR